MASFMLRTQHFIEECFPGSLSGSFFLKGHKAGGGGRGISGLGFLCCYGLLVVCLGFDGGFCGFSWFWVFWGLLFFFGGFF